MVNKLCFLIQWCLFIEAIVVTHTLGWHPQGIARVHPHSGTWLPDDKQIIIIYGIESKAFEAYVCSLIGTRFLMLFKLFILNFPMLCLRKTDSENTVSC